MVKKKKKKKKKIKHINEIPTSAPIKWGIKGGSLPGRINVMTVVF